MTKNDLSRLIEVAEQITDAAKEYEAALKFIGQYDSLPEDWIIEEQFVPVAEALAQWETLTGGESFIPVEA